MFKEVIADRNIGLNLKCNTLSKPNSNAALTGFESGGDLYLSWWDNTWNIFCEGLQKVYSYRDVQEHQQKLFQGLRVLLRKIKSIYKCRR